MPDDVRLLLDQYRAPNLHALVVRPLVEPPGWSALAEVVSVRIHLGFRVAEVSSALGFRPCREHLYQIERGDARVPAGLVERYLAALVKLAELRAQRNAVAARL